MLIFFFFVMICNKFKIGVIPIWLQKWTYISRSSTLLCVYSDAKCPAFYIQKNDYTAWHSTPHRYNKRDRFLLTVILLRGLTRLQLKSFKYKSLFYSCTESVIKLKDLIIIRSIIANAYKIFA